ADLTALLVRPARRAAFEGDEVAAERPGEVIGARPAFYLPAVLRERERLVSGVQVAGRRLAARPLGVPIARDVSRGVACADAAADVFPRAGMGAVDAIRVARAGDRAEPTRRARARARV